MGSIKLKGKKLTIELEIEKIFMSNIVTYQDRKLVEGPTFKSAVADLLLKLANEKLPQLKNRTGYKSSTINLTEDKRSVIVTFE